MKKILTLLLCILLMCGICACGDEKLTVSDIPNEFFEVIEPGEKREDIISRFPDAEESIVDGVDVISVKVYEDENSVLNYMTELDANGLVSNSTARYALKNTGGDFSDEEINDCVSEAKDKILSQLTALYGEGKVLDDDNKTYKWENKDEVRYLLCLPANSQTEVYASFMLQCGPVE